jgi:hypothetical protein
LPTQKFQLNIFLFRPTVRGSYASWGSCSAQLLGGHPAQPHPSPRTQPREGPIITGCPGTDAVKFILTASAGFRR